MFNLFCCDEKILNDDMMLSSESPHSRQRLVSARQKKSEIFLVDLNLTPDVILFLSSLPSHH